MKNYISRVVLLTVGLLASMVCAAEISFPGLTGRVVDQVGILSIDTVNQLNQQLAEHEKTTGNQVVIAVVASLHGLSIEDYGYQLGRAWGLGQKDKSNGLIFLIAPSERKVRIEVGYGLEGTITDAQSKLLLDDIVIPLIKNGHLDDAILAGSQSILQTLSHGSVDLTSRTHNSHEKSKKIPHLIAIIILYCMIVPFILFILAYSILAKLVKRHPSLTRYRLFLLIANNEATELDGDYPYNRSTTWDGDTFSGGQSSSTDELKPGGGSFGGGGASDSW